MATLPGSPAISDSNQRRMGAFSQALQMFELGIRRKIINVLLVILEYGKYYEGNVFVKDSSSFLDKLSANLRLGERLSPIKTMVARFNNLSFDQRSEFEDFLLQQRQLSVCLLDTINGPGRDFILHHRRVLTGESHFQDRFASMLLVGAAECVEYCSESLTEVPHGYLISLENDVISFIGEMGFLVDSSSIGNGSVTGFKGHECIVASFLIEGNLVIVSYQLHKN